MRNEQGVNIHFLTSQQLLGRHAIIHPPTEEITFFSITQKVHWYAEAATMRLLREGKKKLWEQKDAKTNHQTRRARRENNLKAERRSWEMNHGWTQSSSWLFIRFMLFDPCSERETPEQSCGHLGDMTTKILISITNMIVYSQLDPKCIYRMI